MKKYLPFIFINLAMISFSISASEVNIINSVKENDYSFCIEHLEKNGHRTVVTSGYIVDETLDLDFTRNNKTTYPFYIKRSDGNTKHAQLISLEIEPENFRNENGVLQDFYPSVALLSDNRKFGGSFYYGKNCIGKNRNGMRFECWIPGRLNDSPCDLGAFYIYFNPFLFKGKVLDAGLYSSEIHVKIITDK
jgi:hypothetical protein